MADFKLLEPYAAQLMEENDKHEFQLDPPYKSSQDEGPPSTDYYGEHSDTNDLQDIPRTEEDVGFLCRCDASLGNDDSDCDETDDKSYFPVEYEVEVDFDSARTRCVARRAKTFSKSADSRASDAFTKAAEEAFNYLFLPQVRSRENGADHGVAPSPASEKLGTEMVQHKNQSSQKTESWLPSSSSSLRAFVGVPASATFGNSAAFVARKSRSRGSLRRTPTVRENLYTASRYGAIAPTSAGRTPVDTNTPSNTSLPDSEDEEQDKNAEGKKDRNIPKFRIQKRIVKKPIQHKPVGNSKIQIKNSIIQKDMKSTTHKGIHKPSSSPSSLSSSMLISHPSSFFIPNIHSTETPPDDPKSYKRSDSQPFFPV